jgi:hypothetical protein
MVAARPFTDSLFMYLLGRTASEISADVGVKNNFRTMASYSDRKSRI